MLLSPNPPTPTRSNAQHKTQARQSKSSRWKQNRSALNDHTNPYHAVTLLLRALPYVPKAVTQPYPATFHPSLPNPTLP